MLGFVGVALLLVVLIHAYLWKRLVRDPLPKGRARRIGNVVAVVLGLLVPVTLIGVRAGYLSWLAWPGYLWLAVMFYLLVVLLVLEIPRLVLRLTWVRASRRTGEKVSANLSVGAAPATDQTDPGAAAEGIDRRLLLARGAAIFAGLTAAGVTGYGVKTALGAPQLDRVQLPLAKLPRAMDGTRLAVVSDIHLGPLTGSHHVGRIVSLINSVQADIVCVVGDLVDGSVAELGRFAAPLADIESRHGAYFVTGNHEYYSGYREWVDEVARLGVRPLRNERLEIAGLDLAGVNDLGGADVGDPPDFAKALGDRDRTRPVVLMAHQPAAAEQAAPFGVDLQVSGHTHGGQMAPFNLLVKLQQPIVSGLGTVDGMPVYVTNGAGFWGPPVRVGAPPQVTVIELRTS
ncbi:metallophosphoesterase [Actinoplanes sp. TBRC 11911]|uniref:metallophosphoesterase n=1 Tax=Actinoplanes sp. TBRC 11911 TaxID=2729386 RepID=UPI00145DAA50|nr:metallophosphoesterase [Actinoplanes sp. TBRC 11911]NMO54447.1 metallophosphoesterase [Actinoplanes sp. TBRC 11911]